MGAIAPLTAARRWLARRWREVLLACASVVLTYVLLEIGYRVYQYRTLPDRLFAAAAAQLPTGANAQDQFVFDAHTGYRYAPDFSGARGAPWYSHWRTNRHGHVSQFDYPLRKPPGEYRIAVVGDSLTANITNNVRWTELVEQTLNTSPQWRAAVAGQITRVINFGVDGFVMVQFGALVGHPDRDFNPDLLVINVNREDTLRRLRYRNPPDGAADRNETIRAYVRANFLDRVDWLRPYPELFAATIGGWWNMPTALPL